MTKSEAYAAWTLAHDRWMLELLRRYGCSADAIRYGRVEVRDMELDRLHNAFLNAGSDYLEICERERKAQEVAA